MVKRTSFVFGIAGYITQTYGLERPYLCGIGIKCCPGNLADREEENADVGEGCERIRYHVLWVGVIVDNQLQLWTPTLLCNDGEFAQPWWSRRQSAVKTGRK